MMRRIVPVLVLAATSFAPLTSHAFMFGHDTTTAPKGKMIQLTLRNRTAAPMDLLIEDQPITIAAMGKYELKAVEGTHVYGTDKAVKVLVTRDLNGTTCSFR